MSLRGGQWRHLAAMGVPAGQPAGAPSPAQDDRMGEATVPSGSGGQTRRTQAERTAAMRTRLLDATVQCLVA